MVIKETITILLLSGCLHVLAAGDIDKSSELSHEFRKEQVEHFKNKEKKFREGQFEKDYHRWDEKKHAKEEFKKLRDNSDYMNLNAIESHEYVDKYNKYGKTFNPKLVHMKKSKGELNEKRESKEHHEDEHEKPKPGHSSEDLNGNNKKEGNLLGDINVNYVENNKKEGNLLGDIDVNYVENNKKEISKDGEWISENKKEGNLLGDINVNYVENNKKEISKDSEWISENTVPTSKENYKENYQNANDLYMKRYKKDFYQNLNKIDLSNPPPPNDTVLMARYIVHTIDWAALGTLSGRSSTKGSPFVCVKATSDGMQNASSGIPFFYMSPMDLCTQDLQKDNRVSVLVTLSQTDYCKKQNYDPQDPRCAKLTLNGKIKRIKQGSDEEKFARNALFSKHPAMESWPADHNWYFTKLKIGQIILLDQFGGATYIKVKDYLNGKVMEPEPELRKK